MIIKAHGIGRGINRAIAFLLSLSMFSWQAVGQSAGTLPSGGTVVGGSASITQPNANSLIINQTSDRAIINWNDFSIGQGNITQFVQPGSNAATLNRVTGANPSAIYGTLKANGRIYLINQNGILVGSTGVIDTGSFIGSTLDVGNDVFMRGGDLLFSGNSTASIVNMGRIQALGGDVFLFAQRIDNQGNIVAGGTVGLGAGSEILLKSADAGQGQAFVRRGTGSIKNSGNVEAAVAELRAAGGNHYALAINNTGVIRATGAVKRNGRVYLTARNGRISNRGRISASNKDGSGGSVRISSLEQGAVDLSGSIDVTGTTGRGGSIVVEAATITLADATLDASGATGGGEIQVGGGERGEDGSIFNADNVTIDADTFLRADAWDSGDGGKIVVWAVGTTVFRGLATASAQGASGDGGAIEISGKQHLLFTGNVRAGSLAGLAGHVLFDPGTVEIVADIDNDGIPDFADVDQTGGVDADADGIDAAFDADGDVVFDDTIAGVTAADLVDRFVDSAIEAMLQGGGGGGANVTIATAPATGVLGAAEDINIQEGVRVIWSEETTLALNAGNDVNALNDVLIQHSGDGDAFTGGGVVILAGNDINVGAAVRDDTNANFATGVAIGSEYGSNIFVAGDANFDQTPDKIGAVTLTGGETPGGGAVRGGFAQLGYIMGTTRSEAGATDFANGTIIVRAGTDITLTGGGDIDADAISTDAAFAQIGHGGANIVDPFTGATITTVADIVGNIEVTAGIIATGDVTLTSATGATDTDYAQIGHGALISNGIGGAGGTALTHGNISGDITLTIINSDLNLNTVYTPQDPPDGIDDSHYAQVGSGGHIVYIGGDLAGVEATHGNIQGDLTIDVSGAVNLGTTIANLAPHDRAFIQSQIGHGGHIRMIYDGTDVGATGGDGSLDAVHGRIASFDNGLFGGGFDTTNILVTAAEYNIISDDVSQNSGGTTGIVVDNLQRSQIGHGMETISSRFTNLQFFDDTVVIAGVDPAIDGLTLGAFFAAVNGGGIDPAVVLDTPAEAAALNAIIAGAITITPAPTQVVGGSLDISVTEGDIAGNITILDDDVTQPGILLSSTIAAGLLPINRDVMIARIGHASQSYLDSLAGADGADGANPGNVGAKGFDGGDITVTQAHILGANITVTTPGAEGDDQDITLITNIAAGLTPVEDNNAVAQIGHSGDIFAHSGDGGVGGVGTPNDLGTALAVSGASGSGGDITINKGTIWDGTVAFDNGNSYGGTVALDINSSNQVIIDSDTAAALSPADRNNAESQIGSGHRIRLASGNGGSGPDAASGGRGGDILLTQRTQTRDGATDATGIRGLLTVTATHTLSGLFALDITADDTAALSPTNNNTDRSQLGHGDVIEVVSGNGGDGGDANANDAARPPVDAAGNPFQPESFGGRGGHINVALGGMRLESDILVDIRGAARFQATATNALSPSTRNIVEAFAGHGEYIQAHAGDGGNGGDADFLANAAPVYTNALQEEQFFADFQIQNGDSQAAHGGGAARGGNGGDVRITFGDITDRDGEADVQLVITDDNTTDRSLTILAQTVQALGEDVGNDVFAGLGHKTRLYGEAGQGGNGGNTRTEFDNFIQPDTSGGRGGDSIVTSGNIIGDVIADMPREALVEVLAGHDSFTKVYAVIGHQTDVVAVSQNGGNAGRQSEDVPSLCDGACGDGGIDDTTILGVTFIDGNGDDKFDLNGVNDANSTANEDGIDTNGDGVAETITSLTAQFGGNPGFATFDLDGDTNVDAVDVDGDGAIDFVDFDNDGQIDIVDVDQNGLYDQIDGRSATVAGNYGQLDYVAVTGLQPDTTNHLEGGWTLQNRYSQGTNQTTVWSTLSVDARNIVGNGTTIAAVRDHTDIISEDGRALVGDFSNANGGRGGDATTRVGYTVGDVEIDTGSDNDAAANVDSLIVRSTITDLVAATGGPRDLAVARIGHSAFHMSDTGGSYSNRNAGRVETQRLINNDEAAVQGHTAANGGNAEYFAINASGGRGGDALLVQGAARNNSLTGTVNETDHLVGDIYVNVTDDEQPLDLRVGRNNSSDARRITIQATATLDAGTGTSIAQIGHGSEAAASAGDWTGLHGTLINTGEGNTGGNGASTDNGTLSPGSSSQTEIADGGRGGDAVLTQNHIKGDIFVQTGGDDLSGNDFSLQILATKGTIIPSGPNDTIIAQIGHGRIAQVAGSDGGLGDDGQWRGNGGRGGDAQLTQTEIRDSLISVDLVDQADGYFGNGLLIEAQVQESGEHIVRAQLGHGDLAFAEGGAGNNATDADASKTWVIEQLNQTANGGRGGDAIINQAGYIHDIIVDVGSNLTAPDADGLQIISHVDTVLVADQNHVLAAIGHGGYGQAISNNGGKGGQQDGTIPAITFDVDPNQRDGIVGNRIVRGTDRNGGRGGDAITNILVGGTGRGNGDRSGLDHGRTDDNGADIVVTVHDNLDASLGGPAAGGDGILVEARSGQGGNFDRAIDTTTAMIGHHGFNRANATAATGGNGIDATLAASISEGDGGDGGDARSTIGFINGDISVTNVLAEDDLTGAGGANLNNNGDLADTNILINTIDQLPTDGTFHRAEARVGHLVSGEALAGNGGDAATTTGGGPPDYQATITIRGGDGGDAFSSQGQLYGNIGLIAENSIEVLATDGTPSNETLVSAVGHRMENEVVAGTGGLSGDSFESLENLYFIYEALREYAANGQNLSALSEFERKLIEPIISDYFEGKTANPFLDKLLRVSQTTGGGGFTGANDRDNNFISITNFTIPALTAEETETLLALMSASGDGGHATSIQGSTLSINNIDELRSVNGNITLNALARDLTDTTRGITLIATDGGPSNAFEIVHVGHQTELIQARGGDAGLIETFSTSPAMGGDGGNVLVQQYSFDGAITLDSEHKINIEALDGTVNGARQRAWVGHRLTVTPDRPHDYRAPVIVRAGDGGSEQAVTSDGRNGNGGNVLIVQHGAVTNDTDTNIDILIDASNTTDGQDPIDHISIRINAESVGASSEEAETHIGHDMVIASVQAGNAGQRDPLHAPEGLDEGIREGNGGDIGIIQGNIGADIDIVGRDTVDIDALTNLAPNDAHVIIGHERTIGSISDTDNDLQARPGDSTGTIVAGFGGDSIIEDYNDTAEIDPWVLNAGATNDAATAVTGNTIDVEDADAGVIYITTGTLGDSQAAADTDAEVITITSLFGDVTLDTNSGVAGRARIEVGNQQHVHAQTLEASLERDGPPNVRTAGDGGDIRITRGAVGGDILIQALDQDNGNPGPNGDGPNVDDQAVFVHSETGAGGVSEVLIGHETEYGDAVTEGGNPDNNDLRGFGDPDVLNAGTAISTSTGTSGADDQSSGFGEERFADLDGALGTFVGQVAAGTGVAGEATLRDGNDALQDIENVVAVIAMANQNADRYSTADRAALAAALTDAQAAQAAAEAAMTALQIGGANEPSTVAALQIAAASARTALSAAQTTVTAAVDAAGNSLNAGSQIADHADAGDIIYTAADALGGGTITSEGVVSGDIRLISGRDTTGNGSADTFNTGFVNVTSLTGAGGNAQSELGHRRTMHNVTGQGGGDFDGGPEEGGVAGDGGTIRIGDQITATASDELGDVAQIDPYTGNRTSGNVSLIADEVIVRATTGTGATAETHLGHDVEVTNFADQSDLESLLGNGGDIFSGQTVTGNVTINTNHLSSVEDAGNSIIGADSGGGGRAWTHLGHQVDADNDSRSDETIGGTGGDEANRAGEIVTAQITDGNITINLDLDGDDNPSDITIQTTGAGAEGDTRLGHETGQDSFSGDPTDDGAQVVAVQRTSGDIQITEVEDVLIESIGATNNSTYLGHNAHNIAQSGDVNGGTGDEYGELVDADQVVTGNIDFFNTNNGTGGRDPIRSFTLRTGGATAGEAHVGHEGTLSALSGDDTDKPSDGVANDGTGGRPHDVDADQLIQAGLSVRAGEILIESASSAGGDREAEQGAQFGHEAFVIADTDGGRPDATVHSRSYINPADAINGNDDIVLIAALANIPADDDPAGVTSATGVDGDITVRDTTAAGEAQVGHRSHSQMSHAVGNLPTGSFDTLQSIGGEIDNGAGGNGLIELASAGTGAGTLVNNTAASTITLHADRDLNVRDDIGGIAQIGHFITEEAEPLSATAAVQENLAGGALSQVRQVVGSDILAGAGVLGGHGTDPGTPGIGNNLTMISTFGRAEIGHRSPGSNEWQIAANGTDVITPQILDGDIVIEAGVDAGGVINGAAPGDTDAGGDDDILLDGTAGGVVRIGHNHTVLEATGNLTQVAAGDIWVRARSDLHVLAANIGHEHYDHTTTPGTVTPETAIGGVGTVRNRIHGLTTIGAAENSPLEDTVLTPDVLLFDGSAGPVSVNSGYGGQGNADVDGELRFFTPAQENVTIIPGVEFNDSAGGADPVTPRTGDPSNIFLGTGGQDHEHPFTTMDDIATGTSRAYADAFIGAGNYTFYYETPPATNVPLDIDLIRALRERLHSPLGGGFDCVTGALKLSDPHGNSGAHPGIFGTDWVDASGRRVDPTSAAEASSYGMFSGTGSNAGDHCQNAANGDDGDAGEGDDGEGNGDDDIAAIQPASGTSTLAQIAIPQASSASTDDVPLATVVPSAGSGSSNGEYVTIGTAPRRARVLGALAQSGGGVSMQ